MRIEILEFIYANWVWLITWAFFFILIIVLIIIARLIYKKLSITSFLQQNNFELKQNIKKDYIEKKILDLENKLKRTENIDKSLLSEENIINEDHSEAKTEKPSDEKQVKGKKKNQREEESKEEKKEESKEELITDETDYGKENNPNKKENYDSETSSIEDISIEDIPIEENQNTPKNESQPSTTTKKQNKKNKNPKNIKKKSKPTKKKNKPRP
ncbi:MAG: hypothetical protein WC548_04645 [Candidatus Pacearchaeota archaeon]